jgi:hypothetical protein
MLQPKDTERLANEFLPLKGNVIIECNGVYLSVCGIDHYESFNEGETFNGAKSQVMKAVIELCKRIDERLGLSIKSFGVLSERSLYLIQHCNFVNKMQISPVPWIHVSIMGEEPCLVVQTKGAEGIATRFPFHDMPSLENAYKDIFRKYNFPVTVEHVPMNKAAAAFVVESMNIDVRSDLALMKALGVVQAVRETVDTVARLTKLLEPGAGLKESVDEMGFKLDGTRIVDSHGNEVLSCENLSLLVGKWTGDAKPSYTDSVTKAKFLINAKTTLGKKVPGYLKTVVARGSATESESARLEKELEQTVQNSGKKLIKAGLQLPL